MTFFRFHPPIDAKQIQSRFIRTLERHNIMIHPDSIGNIFAKLNDFDKYPNSNLSCPFPLISCVKNAYNHAKKMKAALQNESKIKLGKCQQILADFYGFNKWEFFIDTVLRFETGYENIIEKHLVDLVRKFEEENRNGDEEAAKDTVEKIRLIGMTAYFSGRHAAMS